MNLDEIRMGKIKKNAKIKQQREITHTGRQRATFTVCSSNYLLSDVKVGIIRVLGFFRVELNE